MSADYAVRIHALSELRRAGFADGGQCEFRATRSPFAEIVSLDNRERESLFVEAVK